MNIKNFPSKINGVVAAPPSKSITHRSIILASLAYGTSVIKNALLSDDTKYTIAALKQLGVIIEHDDTKLVIHGSEGKLQAPKEPIFVGNSGSTLRMLSAVAALANGITTITGEKRLCERPITDLLTALKKMNIHADATNNLPPVQISGGKLKGGIITINGSVSSQYITALLLISPFAENTVWIVIDGDLRSKPYVALTLDLMKTFGVAVENKNFKEFIIQNHQPYIAQNYVVEGDYSSASYFFAAAAVTKGKVTVKNLNQNSSQGDRYFLDILERMGCYIERNSNSVTVIGSKNLSGITVDMNDYPDIVQTLAVVAAYAKGTSHITNIGHLKDKETDRIASTAQEFKKMNISVKETAVSLAVVGGKPKGAIIETHNDHRIAMSFAVAGLAAEDETVIKNAQVVNKSYPNFWEDLRSIGANIKTL